MASILPPAPLLEPGFRLDRYELLCKIGQGGMATVWVARTANSHGEERLVAIKTILPSLAANETLRTMLLDEARIAIAIDHPNVARTLEVGQLWDMPYLVLELIEGESVDQLCKSLGELGLTIPAAVTVRIVADAALGLHGAHQAVDDEGENLGIVHRDVAPPNILIDEQGHARVIDFGVAKAAERFTPDTTAGTMKGRVPYMAPEHASGDAVDRRSDIWSLGVMTYVMLTGRYPFEAPNEAARLIRILGTDDPDPLPDAVPAKLQEVILKALSKDPDHRHDTAAELAEDLLAAHRPATHADVATFVQATLAAPISDRHALLENALAAADGRARARELLDGPAPPGSSMSYRPPPVASVQDDEEISGLGTLGTVTRGQRPPGKPWFPWVMAAIIGTIVVIAFALGSFNASAPSGPHGSEVPNPPTTSREPTTRPRAVPMPIAPQATDTQANALAEARAKAEAEADAGTPTVHPVASAKARPVVAPAWVPPSALGRAADAASGPARPAKSAEPEDTIF